jgi:hypothetical protein
MLRRFALPFGLMVQLLHAAQDPRFVVSRYGPEHGLSNRHVLSLVQDRVGFLYAGTVSGLDRFDGHVFRNWGVSEGLSHGRADQLRRDAQGRIWAIATDANEDVAAIDILDPVSGHLQPMAVRHEGLPFDVATVTRIAPQRDDEVLVLGTARPAQCIRFDGARFIVHRLDGDRFDPLGHDRVGNVIGYLMRGKANRIVRVGIDGAVQTASELPEDVKVEPLVTGRTSVGALYRSEAVDGTVRYLDTYSEISVPGMPLSIGPSMGNDPVYRPLNFTPLPARGMHVADTRILDAEGVAIFDMTAQHPELKQRVKACWVDWSGNPWLATEFGLFRIDIRGDRFMRLLHEERAEGGMGVLCRGMASHDGRLYLASEWHGAFVIDPATGAKEALPGSPFLFGLHVSEDGTVWRGSQGAVEWNRPGEALQRCELDDNIWSILRVDEGLVLLGGLKGLWQLDAASRTARKLTDERYPELEQAHILQLRRIDDGRIEAVGSKGIYRLRADGRVLQRFWSGAEGKERIPCDDLHHAYTDKDGVLWLSTRGVGLVRFDPRTGENQQYSMRNGFPNNMVYAAYEDGLEQLWLPTDGGIVRFDKRSRQSTVFTVDDGLTNDEFNRLAHVQATDGRLYFGGLNGITVFHPEEFRRPEGEARFPLVLTSMQRYDAGQAAFVDVSEAFTDGRIVELGREQRSIRIGFSLLSYDRPERIAYAWRIEGLSSDWTYQREPFIRLDRLPSGDHVLHVKARDANGQWMRQELQVVLGVDAPWSESRTAWAFGGALCATLLMAVFTALARHKGSAQRGPIEAA